MSKYDRYWKKKMDDVQKLIKEAEDKGKSGELDISDIETHGARKDWTASITFSDNNVLKGNAAHGTALAELIRERNELDGRFRLKISDDLRLTIFKKGSDDKRPDKNEVEKIDEDIPDISDWPMVEHEQQHKIPQESGIYIGFLKDSGDLFYVGESGNLQSRIKSHYRGSRGADRFCLYVYDTIIHDMRKDIDRYDELDPCELTKEMNRLTRDWIRDHVSFRYKTVDSGRKRLEKELRKKLDPTLNPA